MHFEILVEDQSGKKALDILVPKIIGNSHTFRVHPYKGIGRLPKDLRTSADPNMRILMEQLPRLLNGYGKTFAVYPPAYHAVVILVCDLDDKCLKVFRKELFEVLNSCHPKPETQFCIAIEEGEAWFLGDVSAVKAAYPNAKNATLNSYENDSIHGTWEKLADAIYPGGSLKLSSKGWQMIGVEKSRWAEAITPHM
ncbi:MAG: hypothetical protein PH343_00055, partial [Nitrospira sp.]|nr:hypothetical protein [Nitrospira sp.]